MRMRQTPSHFDGEEEIHLTKILDAGFIQPSISDWASVSVLVRKNCGSVRWCIDYRKMNAVTVKVVFPIPDGWSLAGNIWFSKLYASAAYWQIPIKSVFVFEHVKMCFELNDVPSTCMRASNRVLRGLTKKIFLVFLSDISVLGKTIEENIQHLTQVFERFSIKLKPRKCELFQIKVEFLDRTKGQWRHGQYVPVHNM